MGKFGKYKMLLGEPVRCYYKDNKGNYLFQQTAYYVGNGFCVSSFTDVCDKIPYSVLKFDRYIPIRLFDKHYDDTKPYLFKSPIMNPDFTLEDFNTENLVDFYEGHLNEFWWWNEIQDKVKEEINR